MELPEGDGVEIEEVDGLGLGDGEAEAEGEGLGLIDGFGVALTVGFTEGFKEGEGEGEGLGSSVGLGEREAVVPRTSSFGWLGKNTDLNQNPEPVRITRRMTDKERVSRDGFC